MIFAYLILTLALILRLINLENIALGDEFYSLYIINNPDFFSIFKDMGNPWFYYLICKIEYYLFNFHTLGYKLTSVIFNIIAIIMLWFMLKKNFNLKIANISALLASINPIMIYYSHEIRCYSLTMLLSTVITYLLFEIIKKKKNIYFILYAVFGIIAINTHYYETIFLFLNFVFALFFLKKKNNLKFISINILILLSFLPFLYISLKNIFLNPAFNSWLEDVSFNLIINQIRFIFSCLLSFILFLIFYFIATRKANFKKRLWLNYLFYIILSTIIISIIISLLIKPIITQRYYCFLIPLFIAFLAIIFGSFKQKTYFIIFILWIFLIQYCTKINSPRSIYKKEISISSMLEDNKNNYILVKTITKFYFIDKYKNINIVTIPLNEDEKLQKIIRNEIKYIFSKNQNATIYTVLLKPDKITKDFKYTCYYNKETNSCLWKIQNK